MDDEDWFYSATLARFDYSSKTPVLTAPVVEIASDLVDDHARRLACAPR